MLKKLFAAAICGAVIASISTQADAAGPGGFARGFAKAEHAAVLFNAQPDTAAQADVARREALSALNRYFDGFDTTHTAE